MTLKTDKDRWVSIWNGICAHHLDMPSHLVWGTHEVKTVHYSLTWHWVTRKLQIQAVVFSPDSWGYIQKNLPKMFGSRVLSREPGSPTGSEGGMKMTQCYLDTHTSPSGCRHQAQLATCCLYRQDQAVTSLSLDFLLGKIEKIQHSHLWVMRKLYNTYYGHWE